MIAMKEPDLIFLDVQMPDIDGFEVLSRLKTGTKPYIIFTTAYDSYAIQAFDVHALDYLLKPIDEDRFNESMSKIVEHFDTKRASEFNDKLVGLLNEFKKDASEYQSSFTIKEKGKEIHVNTEDICYVEANGNYVNLKLLNKTYLYRTTMSTAANLLDPKQFIRIHRSYILNKTFIHKCRYMNNNEYEFTLKNDEKIISGRSYNNVIKVFSSE